MSHPPAYEMLLNRWWREMERVQDLKFTRTRNTCTAEKAVGQLSAINTYRETVGYVKSF